MASEDYPEFVNRYYTMNPEIDVLLFDGNQLEEGMVVLAENYANRTSLQGSSLSPEQRQNARIWNRWFTVSNIVVDDNSQEIHFIATYEDSEQRKMTVPIAYAWLAKKDSVPERIVVSLTDSTDYTFNPRIV